MGVLALWRYPVKAMLGQLLDAVEIGAHGCTGDRRWIAVDADTGQRIANKRGPTDPRLRACRAELVDDSDHELPLRVTLPDGETLEGGETEDALSQLLERRIRLEQADTPALGRIAATGAHHDAAPIHLITTSTLAHLRAIAPTSDWDVRRFRPNLLLDDGTTQPPSPKTRSSAALSADPRDSGSRSSCRPRAASSRPAPRKSSPPTPASCARSSNNTASTSGHSDARAASALMPKSPTLAESALARSSTSKPRRNHPKPRSPRPSKQFSSS